MTNSGTPCQSPATVLAAVATLKGDPARAIELAERAVAIRERTHGPSHPYTADSLLALADARGARHEYRRAEPLYRRAIAIREAACGPNHEALAVPLERLARLERR